MPSLRKLTRRIKRSPSRLHRLDDDLRLRVSFDPLQHRLHDGEVRGRTYLLAEGRLQVTLCLKQVRGGVEELTRRIIEKRIRETRVGRHIGYSNRLWQCDLRDFIESAAGAHERLGSHAFRQQVFNL